MTPERTPRGQWVLYECATGQRMERWPVDARGMLATGAYTADPSELGIESLAASVTAPSEPPALVATALPDGVPTEYAPGVPLVVTRAHEAASTQPMQDPVRSSGRRGR